jgi:hypothetical protein
VLITPRAGIFWSHLACDTRLKGGTTFRPNPVTGVVLNEDAAGVEAPRCCVLEREAD